jgi:hypothetical protein
MDKFRADFRALDKLNIVKLGKPVTPGPARKTLNQTESKVVDSLASFGQMLGQPTANLIKELARIPKSPPAVTVLPPLTVSFGLGPSALKVITLSIGGNLEAFGLVGATFQSGLYGSNSPELGIFTSVGAGLFTGVGVSSGLVLTCVFGPPSSFAGIAWGVGVDVTIPGLNGLVAGGAMLLFTAPPTVRFLGYSAGLSAGFSGPLPITVSLQVSSTATKPLLKP